MSEGYATSRIKWGSRIAPAVTALTRFFAGGEAAAVDETSQVFEHWTGISDGLHNLTTDLIRWRGRFFLVHSNSPWHIASTKSRLIVWASDDCKTWEKQAEFRLPGGDIRDPKFAVMGDRLFLYVLRNVGFVAEPSETSFTFSDDGKSWSDLKQCDPKGWLFWRPKTLNGTDWYVPAYWHEHGKAVLLKSRDGENWSEVSSIYTGDHNDETDIEFLPDGRMIATARLEMRASLLGDHRAGTWIAVSELPYVEWRGIKSLETRLDGPNLFAHGGRVFAVGRRHLDTHRRWRRTGSFLGRKRTSVYWVHENGLERLFDLPSCGDTGYAGVVLHEGNAVVSYYTNDPKKDLKWVTGMFLPSEIRMARIPLAVLDEKVSEILKREKGGSHA